MRLSGLIAKSFPYACLFPTSTSAHRLCTSCIPLNDLLTEAYGIEIAMNGLYVVSMYLRMTECSSRSRISAVAFHNGSMAAIATMNASPEYVALMRNAREEAIGQGTQKRATRCLQGSQSSPLSSLDRSLLDFLFTVVRWPQALWKSTVGERAVEVPPLHPIVQLIQEQLLALPPFSSMTSETLAQSTIGVVIPSWLAGSELACHVAEAVKRTFGRLAAFESPPSSAYTAAGFELCRIDSDAFECTGPGRIMTLEYDGNTIVASLMQSPLSSWSANTVTFSMRSAEAPQRMVDWMDDFVEAERPDRLMLVGSRTEDAVSAGALVKSHAASILEKSHALLPPQQILALGAAQAAKGKLETQIDDCGEPEECVELRREADRIAGVYRSLKPSAWPVSRPYHAEL